MNTLVKSFYIYNYYHKNNFLFYYNSQLAACYKNYVCYQVYYYLLSTLLSTLLIKAIKIGYLARVHGCIV